MTCPTVTSKARSRAETVHHEVSQREGWWIPMCDTLKDTIAELEAQLQLLQCAIDLQAARHN